MGVIILHVGLPKAGSSSIQRWLRDNDRRLERTGRHLLVYRHDPMATVVNEIAPRRRGTVNSGTLAQFYNISKRSPAFLRSIFDALDRWSDELGTVVMTGEGIGQLFAEPDEAFLLGLDSLASKHTVRVAYYVRAQHETIEAAWRQWGFRGPRSPREYVEIRAALLDYADTVSQVRRLAPHVSFEVRLFHPAAFTETDIVGDFTTTFLDLDEPLDGAPIWANPGLPLELTNLLRGADAGRFWSSLHDNAKIAPLKNLTTNWRLPESDATRRSRLLLQQYCHERFEAGNATLARELHWPIRELVEPVTEPGFDEPDLGELDRLWASEATPAEREVLFLALELLLEQEARQAMVEQSKPAKPANQPVRSEGRSSAKRADKRAQQGEAWIAELVGHGGASPFLSRRSSGSVYVVEGGNKRAVKSGILAAALEDAMGGYREVDDGDLDALTDGPPVELFEAPDGAVFFVLGGQYRRARGVPLTHPVGADSVARLTTGPDIDVARSNVSRRRMQQSLSGGYQLKRVQSSLANRGVVGTARAATGRAARAVKKRTSR